MVAKPLTDTKIKNAKPGPKPVRLFDSGGLYLEVSPAGGKWWRFKYRFGGKEKRLSLGVYADVGLKKARERRDHARRLLADDIDPSAHRKAKKATKAELASNSFEVVSREWFAKQAQAWVPSHADRVIRRLERDAFPWIGNRSMREIGAQEMLAVVRRVESRGALETAHRLLTNLGQVFRYAIATGRVDRNPVADLRGALPPVRTKHHAAIIDPKGVGELLLAIDGYQGSPIVHGALKLAPLVLVRPGELRHARWEDINLDSREWRFIVSKTKKPHIVPLSAQAKEILGELYPLTGCGEFVFPGLRRNGKPMSENAVLVALRSMGIPKEKMTGHGFRAMARTLLDEILHVPVHLIEHQLAHAVKDPLGRAYNRATFLEERVKMMQQWGDYLDMLRTEKTP